MTQLFWICLAGAVGTGLRYLVGLWALRAFGATFPFGTLLVNLTGSFLIALVVELALTTAWIGPTLRLTLTTGFMGGLTTYSAFNEETLRYFDERAWRLGALNMFVTVGGCLLAGVLGLLLARRVAGGAP
jgi:fluoride exporter